MTSSPETHPSLVVRLRNAADHAAWTEFLAIYEPLILRILRGYALQEPDARDLCQQVLTAVARDVDQWKSDGAQASFRRWLFQIARNRALKFLTRQRPGTIGQGGSDAHRQLSLHPDRQDLSAEFEAEYRQQLLLCAAGQIRSEFRESTWQAFWRTCIDGCSIADAARDLGMTAGNVYVARSRVMARLRERVRSLQAGDEPAVESRSAAARPGGK